MRLTVNKKNINVHCADFLMLPQPEIIHNVTLFDSWIEQLIASSDEVFSAEPTHSIINRKLTMSRPKCTAKDFLINIIKKLFI